VRCTQKYLLASVAFVLFCSGVPLPIGSAGAAPLGIEAQSAFTDQGGRRISAANGFERIISLYGAHTENLFFLGAGSRTIGVSRSEAYPPEALTRPVFSYHDDPEKFLGARPDLVLIRPMIDRGYPQFVQRLEKSGITVVSLQPGTLDEMFVYWEILGMLTGRQRAAARMIGEFNAAIDACRALTAAIPVKKKVYFEAIHGKMKTFSPAAMPIFALQTAGGINLAEDARPVRDTNIAAYGKERILSHAADIDVYLAQSGAMNRPTPAMIQNEPGFQAIKAVRENQIFIVDETLVSRPTFRLLEGIFRIGSILYPEVFTETIRDRIIPGGK